MLCNDSFLIQTAHATLLKKMGDYCDDIETKARNGMRIDIEYYKVYYKKILLVISTGTFMFHPRYVFIQAILNAIHGLEFVASNAISLRGLYNVLHNNIDVNFLL